MQGIRTTYISMLFVFLESLDSTDGLRGILSSLLSVVQETLDLISHTPWSPSHSGSTRSVFCDVDSVVDEVFGIFLFLEKVPVHGSTVQGRCNSSIVPPRNAVREPGATDSFRAWQCIRTDSAFDLYAYSLNEIMQWYILVVDISILVATAIFSLASVSHIALTWCMRKDFHVAVR